MVNTMRERSMVFSYVAHKHRLFAQQFTFVTTPKTPFGLSSNCKVYQIFFNRQALN